MASFAPAVCKSSASFPDLSPGVTIFSFFDRPKLIFFPARSLNAFSPSLMSAIGLSFVATLSFSCFVATGIKPVSGTCISVACDALSVTGFKPPVFTSAEIFLLFCDNTCCASCCRYASFSASYSFSIFKSARRRSASGVISVSGVSLRNFS